MKNGPAPIPAPLLDEASRAVSRRTGLRFQEGRRSELERGLRLAVRELGFEDVLSGIKWLISSIPSRSQIEVFAKHLTVGETYFFRGKKCFDFLEGRVLPELIDRRRHTGRFLRVWSAGCCSGEEPYSVAILLSRILPDPEHWSLRILGTDINPLFLDKASAGIYGNWSFRETPEWVKEGYFTRTAGNRFALNREIRTQVTFGYHNLVDDEDPSFPGGTREMDLILCRNVLMYLTPDHQEEVVQRLKGHLVEDGWLIVSPSEVSHDLFRDFESVSFQGATYYRSNHRNNPKGAVGVPSFDVDSRDVLLRSTAMTPLLPEDGPPIAKGLLSEEEGPLAAEGGEPGSDGADPRGERPDPYEEALLLHGKGLSAEAAERLKPLVSKGPRPGRAAAILSRILADQGRLSEAIDSCQKAISFEKADPDLYYLRAVIREELGEPESAKADLGKALYLEPGYVAAHLLLGSMALREGKRKEGARHFRNALDLLRRRLPDEIVRGAEGLTAGRLIEIVRSIGLEDVA